TVPTPVEVICKNLGILLNYHSGLSCESLIAKKNGKTGIIINDRESNWHRKRFSIGHELGHYSIPAHLQDTYQCNLNDLNHYYPDKIAELEANQFASELLMPSNHFLPDVKKHELSLFNLIELSNKYDTSLISTAIRFIKTTEDLGAIVLSKDKNIKWTFHSPRFFGVIKDRGPLHISSTAHDYFEYGIDLPTSSRRVSSDVWSNHFSGTTLIEETLSMPLLELTLSVIKPLPEYVDEHYNTYYG
ncbi:MAG: ImmA/IrrE family metallo-endopeptidase, partial [Desulfosporosinus sp.]|nr:ImmA/IrrE family metallo-endopeptidase [Desulfosporosinus sp.]